MWDKTSIINKCQKKTYAVERVTVFGYVFIGKSF